MLQETTTRGSDDSKFDNPEGIAIDSSGNIWVVDSDNNRIKKHAPDGTFLFKFGIFGNSDGELNAPKYLAIDSADNIWISDSKQGIIQKFQPDGTFLLQIGSTPGSGDDELNFPLGLAVDSADNIWISDKNNDRIKKHSSDGSFLLKIGTSLNSNADSDFNDPEGLAIDSSGNIWVADKTNDRIKKHAPDGTFLFKFGTPGSADGEIDSPTNLAIDSADNIWISDSKQGIIQKFQPDGTFLLKVGESGSGYGQLNNPVGLAVDSLDDVLVANSNNHQINEYDVIGPKITIASSSGSSGSSLGSLFFNYTVTFNESTSDFALRDIVISGTANGGSPEVSNFAGSGSLYTFDVLRGSSDGTVSVTVPKDVVTDSVGNDNTASNTYLLTFDTAPPTPPTFTSPSPEPSTSPIVTFTGTGENGSTIQLISNTGGVVGSTVVTDGQWSITSSELTHGIHIISLTATDSGGNESSVSDPQIIRIVTQVPVKTIGVKVTPSDSKLDITWVEGLDQDTVNDYVVQYKLFPMNKNILLELLLLI